MIIDDKLVMLLPEEEKRGKKKFVMQDIQNGMEYILTMMWVSMKLRTELRYVGTKKHEIVIESVLKIRTNLWGPCYFVAQDREGRPYHSELRIHLGGIRRCFRFHVDEVLKQPQTNNKADLCRRW